MAVSLEARVPLLSKEIIEFSFSLPEGIRYHNGKLKGLLKESFNNIIPDEVINRDKKGFSIPTKKWKSRLYSGYDYPQEKILKLYKF